MHIGKDELLKFLDVYVGTIGNPKQCLDYFEKHVLEPFPDIVREPLVWKLKQDIDDKFLHTPVIDVPPESTPRIRKFERDALLDFPYQPTRLELDAKNAFMSEYPYLTRSIDYCKQRFDKLLFEFPSLNGDVDIMRVRKEIADAIDKRLLMENTVKGCVIKLYHNDGSVGVDRLHTEADYQKWIRNAFRRRNGCQHPCIHRKRNRLAFPATRMGQLAGNGRIGYWIGCKRKHRRNDGHSLRWRSSLCQHGKCLHKSKRLVIPDFQPFVRTLFCRYGSNQARKEQQKMVLVRNRV